VSIYKAAWTEEHLLLNDCVEVVASSPHEAGRKYAAMGYTVPRSPHSGSVAVKCPDGSVVEIEIESTQPEEGGPDA
jgi:hypothetical protein